MVFGADRFEAQVFWPKVVLKKWLNLRRKDYRFNADDDDDDGDVNGEQGRLTSLRRRAFEV